MDLGYSTIYRGIFLYWQVRPISRTKPFLPSTGIPPLMEREGGCSLLPRIPILLWKEMVPVDFSSPQRRAIRIGLLARRS